MNLKILLTETQQIKWVRRIDKKILDRYKERAIVYLNGKINLSAEDKKALKKLNIKVNSYDNLGVKDSISQELSRVLVEIIRNFFKKINQDEKIENIVTYNNVNLLSVMANDMYYYHYRDFLLFVSRLYNFILDNKKSDILVFGQPSLGFFSPERPYVKFLFDEGLTYIPLIKEVCQRLGVSLIIISHRLFSISLLKLKIRHFVFTIAKFLKIFWRHFLARLPIYKKAQIKDEDKKIIGVIIRADAEYYAIKPVLEKIKNGEPELQAIILQSDMFLQPQSWKTLKHYQEEFISLYSLTSFKEFLRGFIQGLIRQMKFKRALKDVKLDIYKTNCLTNGSLSTDILGKDYIAREVLKSIICGWPETIIFIEELKKFIEEYNPKLLISMGMVDHWVVVTSLLSNQYSIPTISFQTTAMETHILPSPIYANKFLVYGEDMKNGLVGSGIDPNKVIVTGAPKYDKYLQCSKEEINQIKEKIKKEINISEKTKILLVTTQPTDFTVKSLNDELISLTLKFSELHPDVYVIIKLHPRDPFQGYTSWQELIKKKKLRAQIVQKIDVIDLMFISDVLLSRSSTTILDALIFDVPPLVLLDSYTLTWVSELDYLRTKATTKINSKKKLIEVLEQAFYQNSFRINFERERKYFLEKSIGTTDGQATKRAIEVIKSMI